MFCYFEIGFEDRLSPLLCQVSVFPPFSKEDTVFAELECVLMRMVVFLDRSGLRICHCWKSSGRSSLPAEPTSQLLLGVHLFPATGFEGFLIMVLWLLLLSRGPGVEILSAEF